VKAWCKISTVTLLVILGGVLCFLWRQGGPRRDTIKILNVFSRAINPENSGVLLENVVLPRALQNQTIAEQSEFLIKALRDEISPDGVLALKHHAEFGSLEKIFPDKAAAWCKQANANPYNCVAFKMEHDGIRAEVVLVREGQTYRVVRCNNVKQMAGNN
jgi:hypothetical protein